MLRYVLRSENPVLSADVFSLDTGVFAAVSAVATACASKSVA